MPIGRIILKSISQSKKLSRLKSHGARLLYTWLIPNLDKNGCFSGEADVIKGMIFTRLNDSIGDIENYLNDLEISELIVRYKVNGDLFLNVPDFEDRQPNLNKDREGKTNIPLPTPDLIQSKSRLNPPKDKISKDKISKDKHKVIRHEVIKHLNEKTGKNFHPDAKETVEFINGRLNDSKNPATKEDLIRVINVKSSQWLNDIKSNAWLRPSTLFRVSNFENYRNEGFKKPYDREAEAKRMADRAKRMEGK